MKNVLQSLATKVLIPLGLTAAASVADTRTHKNILGYGTTALIISNEEIEDIMKIVKFLKDSALLLKDVTQKIKNKTKEQRDGFLGMLFSTLGASLLGNMLAEKGVE